jgi:hypothetical protein
MKTGITSTVPEDQYTFVIISLQVLRKMRDVSDKLCRENQNTFYGQKLFLIEPFMS